MITDFRQFGIEHVISLIIPCIIGFLFIFQGITEKSDTGPKRLRLLFVMMMVVIRGSRYVMDIYYGRFDWFDLFSLQICHIDLVLLIVCLIKPSQGIFNFNFLIGIPMGLLVALMPGSNHPVPGVPRAMLFIMSHMMLVMGALYLAIVECMRPKLRYFFHFAVAGNVGILCIYGINKLLSTNFLYIMSAPEGTAIKSFDRMFGWPGYIIAMDMIALALMLLMLVLSKLILALSSKIVTKTDLVRKGMSKSF